jgi:hypothetical protein
MGATSGQCAGKDGKCCGSCKGDKANMGAVSGEKKSCGSGKTCGDKGAMGAVSGEKSCASKSSCGGK